MKLGITTSILTLAVGILLTCASSSAEVKPAWQAGEELNYAVRYGPIRAGNAKLAVEKDFTWKGIPSYRLHHSATSAGWFFYRVSNSIVSYIASDGLLSLRHEKVQREGDYRNNEVVLFDRDDQVIRQTRNENERAMKYSDIRTVDLLTALYQLRSMDLQVGQVVKIPVIDGDEEYILEVPIRRKEKTNVPAGEFNCLVLEPRIKSDGLFNLKGRLVIWITDDERHIPVKIRAMIPVGTVVASLESFEGLTR